MRRRKQFAGILAAVALVATPLLLLGTEQTRALVRRLTTLVNESPQAFSVLLTMGALLLIWVLSRRLEEALLQDAGDLNTRHKTRKVVAWGRMFLSGLVILLIWAQRVQGLGVFLGLLGAGLTLSVQESLLCIAGWGLILTRRPFDIGDRIEVDTHIGDVIDVRIFYTTLLEVGNWCAGEMSTGRIVHIPNSYLFRKVSLNYSQGFPFIWNEATVVITFESDWREGRKILEEWAGSEADKIESQVRRCLDSGRDHFPIKYRQLRPIVYTAIVDHGVALSLRYLCPVRRRRVTEHELAMHVLDRVTATPNVEFAYPTTRFFTAGEGAGPRAAPTSSSSGPSS